MTMRKLLVGAFALALALPSLAQAQAPAGEWAVDLRGGALLYDEASAIQTGALVGIDALYYFSPRLGVGPAIDYAQAETDGEFFVAVVPFGSDSSRIFQVSQVISGLHYGVTGLFDILPDSRYAPYVTAGGGGYRLYLDPQSNDQPSTMDGGMAQVGGGIRLGLTEATGLQLEARDVMYFSFDREQLNPVDPRLRNCGPPPATDCFPGQNLADAPEAKDLVHNFRITLGFSYVPGLNR